MKAGTSTLHAHLQRHPSIFLPTLKEPHYFSFGLAGAAFAGPGDARLNRAVIRDPARYSRLYARSAGRLRGDASASYLHHAGTAARIAAARPDARIIVVLRHPVDRAYSAWSHLRRDGLESLGFTEALAQEPTRVAAGWSPLWHYRAGSDYAPAVSEYLAAFPREQMLVVLLEDIARTSEREFDRVHEFLGVAPAPAALAGAPRNQSGLPRSRMLYRTLSATGPVRRATKAALPSRAVDRLIAMRDATLQPIPKLAPDLREHLAEQFAPAIWRTEELIGSSLSGWRP